MTTLIMSHIPLLAKKTKLKFGLTGNSGIYLIINRVTRRIYLGGAANLAQRKGEHNRTFKNQTLL
jgi:hypothetical protein